MCRHTRKSTAAVREQSINEKKKLSLSVGRCAGKYIHKRCTRQNVSALSHKKEHPFLTVLRYSTVRYNTIHTVQCSAAQCSN